MMWCVRPLGHLLDPLDEPLDLAYASLNILDSP
jgi:hypothetical protein